MDSMKKSMEIERPKASPRKEATGDEEYHRGKPTSSALYDLHNAQLRKQESRKKEVE